MQLRGVEYEILPHAGHLFPTSIHLTTSATRELSLHERAWNSRGPGENSASSQIVNLANIVL